MLLMIFPSKRSSKIAFQTSPEVRHQFRRKLRQLHSGNRWCLFFSALKNETGYEKCPETSPKNVKPCSAASKCFTATFSTFFTATFRLFEISSDPRQTKPKTGQFMNFSQGHSGTKVRYVNRACFPKKKHQNSQKWAKFMNLACGPFLWFGLPGRLLLCEWVCAFRCCWALLEFNSNFMTD